MHGLNYGLGTRDIIGWLIRGKILLFSAPQTQTNSSLVLVYPFCYLGTHSIIAMPIAMFNRLLLFTGNLTLFGSVANLIVSQKSKETLSYRLTFWKFLRFGFITTVPILVIGVIFLYGLLQV